MRHLSIFTIAPPFNMLGTYVASDLGLDTIATHLPIKTELGKEQFTERLLHPSSNPSTLRKLQTPILALRRIPLESLHKALDTFQTTEATFQECSASMDPLVEESTEQVVWNPSSTFGRFCNHSPLLLESLLTWKTLILPTITILSPLLAVLIPYLLLRPPLQEYLTRVRAIVRGAITVPSILQSKGDHDRIGFMLESFYICIMIGICLMSLWSQITSAMHLRSIAASLREKGNLLHTGIEAAKSIHTILSKTPHKIQRALQSMLEDGTCVLAPFYKVDKTGLGLYAYFWKNTSALQKLHEWVARVDTYVAIASLRSICFPRWSTTPQIEFRKVIHPGLTNPVANDFITKKGAILTGPNRGGKSTFCKAIGLSIVCAQSWGFAFASSATLSPFARIETALSPADTLGRHSLFEAELEFAKSVVESSDQPMFVMMDEIFHSTNAHDGVEASRVFLQRLYELPQTISLISTHYRTLADEFSQIQPLQAETFSRKDRLEYTYKILPGSSTASSVMEILREKGLLKNHVPSTEP
jgi:hypothetical protein